MERANVVFIEQGPQFIFSMTICAPVLRAACCYFAGRTTCLIFHHVSIVDHY